jgi:hypothetical protein
VLANSPFFAAVCREQLLEAPTKRIDLPEEIPEVFSSILEYLYKGDYYPRLVHDKRRNAYELEDTAGHGGPETTVYHPILQQLILKVHTMALYHGVPLLTARRTRSSIARPTAMGLKSSSASRCASKVFSQASSARLS